MIKVKRALSIIVILALLIGSIAPFLASMSPAIAQETEKFREAPLNPDFLDFLEQPPEPFYGYVPPTMDLSHLKEIPVQREYALQALPATFDWRDTGKVTPVKNQNPCGTCWIHGTLAAVESRVWIVDGVEYDFSEQNAACCLDLCWVYFHGNRCDRGGNSFKATDVLNKKGTRLESCDPYNTGTINTEACNDACTTIKRITGYRLVADSASQITEVKNAVYDYGPVSMAYRHDDAYFDPVSNIYYWPDCAEDANHLVCIVGWDDTVEWPGGASNGAWIVKNSWGTGFGDAGYFYLCYGSANMEEVASYRYEDYDINETVYYWDEAGIMSALGAGSTSGWMASIFTSGQDGNLTHVDFWTTSNNAAYEVYVYDGSFGSQLAYQTGSCAELGYYSIPLTTPVSVTNGQQFTVAVKMTTPGFDYPIPVEYVETDICEPPIQAGVSFLSIDGSTWADAAGVLGGRNVCLRAKITTPAEPPAVTTDAATDVTTESATLNGSLDSLGDYTTVNVSFEWGTTSGTLDQETTPEAMTSTGAFSANLSSLSSDIIYYFRAKATGSVTVYGDELSFTTGKTSPAVTTNGASDVTNDSATLNGSLASLGDYSPVNVSFEWGTTSGTLDQETTPEAMTSTGAFSANLSSLSSDIIYYFRAKATGSVTVYGDELSFTTGKTSPAVTTNGASDVTNDSATLNGSLASLGDYSPVNVSFEWGTTSGTLDQETTPEAMTSTGAFSANLSSLSSDTTYYFRAKATGSVTVYGDELSFTTTDGEEEEFDPWVYDADEDGVIEIDEVLTAISDYFATEITIIQVLQVISLYFSG